VRLDNEPNLIGGALEGVELFSTEFIDENGGGPGGPPTKATPEEDLVDPEIIGEPRLTEQTRFH
jgi:hypothetical protein